MCPRNGGPYEQHKPQDDSALLDAFVGQCVVFQDSVVVKLNYSDPETKKEPAQLELERVREISGWRTMRDTANIRGWKWLPDGSLACSAKYER